MIIGQWKLKLLSYHYPRCRSATNVTLGGAVGQKSLYDESIILNMFMLPPLQDKIAGCITRTLNLTLKLTITLP